MRRLAALLLAAVASAGGGLRGEAAGHHAAPEVVVGSAPDAGSMLLAAIYVAALRSYGFGARTGTAADPMAKLDSGEFTVVPAFTGRVLQTLQPGASALSDAQVYRAMVSALPEGVAAGDYTTSAEDKPVLVVTGSTADAWGGNDLSALPKHCDGLAVGIVAGFPAPSAVGSCRLPAPREFPSDDTAFRRTAGRPADRGVDHHRQSRHSR